MVRVVLQLINERFSSNLGLGLRFASWPTALIGIVVIKAVLALAVKPGSFLFSYSGISYFLLLLLATSFAIRNAVQNTLGSRPFWVFLATGYGLWVLDQWIFLYYELGLHVEVPENSIADPVLFLHIVPFMAAVATLPHRDVSGRKPYRAILGSLLLLFFWSLLYTYGVFPYQYLFANATNYGLRFDTLYLLENWTLVLALGILSLRARAPWKAIYLHLLGASTLYALSSAVANLAIDSGGYVNGKLYGLGLIASVCWFVWIPLRARQLAWTEGEITRSDIGPSSKASAWAMLAVVVISIPIVWELFQRDEATSIRTFRVLAAIAAIVALSGAAYIKEVLAKSDLASRLGLANERLRLAVEAGKSVGWEWDLRTGRDSWFGDLQTMFGIPSDTFVGRPEDFHRYVHPDDRQLVTKTVADARESRKPYTAEFRVIRLDGTVRWVAAKGEFYYSPEGEPERMLGMATDITERKQADEKLKVSEEHNRQLVQSASVAMIVSRGLEQEVRLMNDRFTELFGYTIDDVPDVAHWWPLAYPDEAYRQAIKTEWQARVERAIRDRTDIEPMEAAVRCKDGSIRDIEVHLSYMGDTNLITFIDLTERKRQEAGLRESEERLRIAAEVGRMYAWEWDPVTDSVRRSAECAGILGLSEVAGQGIAKDYLRTIHPDDRAELWSRVDSLTPENRVYRTQYRRFRPDGALLWLEESGCATFDGEGKMVRLVGMTADITERKQAEEALRESEERFRLAAQAGKIYAYDWDVATDKVVRSEEHVNVLGFCEPVKQLTRQQILARVHPDDRALFIASVEQLTSQKPTTSIGFRVLRPDGSVVWLEKSARAFFDEKDRMVRVIGMVADITERRRAEEALRESEDKLRLLLDSTAEAIYGIDREHRCTFCNTACLRALGYERVEDLLGKNMHDLIHHTRADGSSFPREECPVFRESLAGKGIHADDDVLWRANRTSFPAEYWSYPQRRGQEVVGAVVAFIDITQRKLVEKALASVSRRLIEAQEQERTRIARELHDDIGQRLAMLVIGLEQLHQDSADLPAEIGSRTGELWRQTSEIATDIQSLSHELHSSKLEYLGITAAIRSFCKEFGEQQNVEIDFQTHDLPSPLPPDLSLCFFRVLQEAVHNAAKHSGVGHFKVRLWGTSGEIHLVVSDSGSGFDIEAARTSRGLGLINMEERLKLVKGTLSIDSQPQRGTTIHARVPLRSERDSMRIAG
jgi:PAS domain S-box-containing protein